MKIYTNKNNTSTLKLLIAANLAGKAITLQESNFEEIFAGPRQLPLLEVDPELIFFSSNAATQYLFPVLDLSEDGQCEQLQEWEATRLQPAIASVLSSKSVSLDLKQALQVCLQTVDGLLQKNKYLLGDKLSAADIAIWSTLYPLQHNDDLKQQYISNYGNLVRWSQELEAAKAVQKAVTQWGGSPGGPFGASSVLGIPQVPGVSSPVASPEDGTSDETRLTPEEVEAAEENWLNGHKNMQKPLQDAKIVLPIKGRKNILVTSALPYVNNIPHLGNIIGCVLSADIFARYCRLCDYNTLYICGTDEYGTATETKALEEGLEPLQICNKYFEIHNSVYRWFNIGFDYFGRTTTDEQTLISQQMFLKLRENGFLSAQSVQQLLCEKCGRFLADRFVEGTCPHPGCGYEDARGDQCDKCGKLINAVELLQPRCKVCGHTPVVRPSEQMFLELGQLEPSIRTWISTVEKGWSPSARAVARSWLREPLRARAITRDLQWGVQVPIEKFKNKVFYVWFDAPIGYMSITQNATKQYEKWWKPDKEYDVTLYQFMAKDNVPFHAVMFPATILGVNEGHLLVKHLYATEYLNYEDSKFSKSRGVGVFGTDAQETGIPSDVWRFYLASIRPETSDSSFSWSELGTRNNSELLNNLGNFCHRSLSFCANTFKGRVPEIKLTRTDYELIALVNRELIAYVQHMEKGRLRDGLRNVLAISRLGNQYMQAEHPWVLLKGSDEDKERGGSAIGLCCQLVALVCATLSPFTPDAARRLRAQLDLPATALRINPTNPSLIQYLPPGHVIGKPEPLFAKIDQELLNKLRAKYSGTQSERLTKDEHSPKENATEAADLEKAIAEQLKRMYTAAQCLSVTLITPAQAHTATTQAQASSTQAHVNGASDVASLEKAIAEQGEKVRQLKASVKDKNAWMPEVNKLLSLKKQLATAQSRTETNAPVETVASLEKAIVEQGDKVRKLKASTKDKSVWQPEVNVLLDLKKRLAALQTSK